MDKKGVVRSVAGNTCTVYLYDEKRDVSVSINNVDPGEPVKQDKVRQLCCLSYERQPEVSRFPFWFVLIPYIYIIDVFSLLQTISFRLRPHVSGYF